VYTNVRYTLAIVNRTGIADMETTEDEAPTAKAPAKLKSKKRTKPKAKKRKTVKAKKKTARKAKVGAVVRSERLDMRLTKAEKAKINAKAKKTRRTVTSLIIEAIEKIR
jgi:cobalamin-dependent methionine synthase I